MGKTLNHLQEDEYFLLMIALEGKQRYNQCCPKKYASHIYNLKFSSSHHKNYTKK